MNAAIYARKSNEQDGPVDAKSISRQIDGARRFIARQHWTLDESHVYGDDGISGALFASRAEFKRLMDDATAGAFGAVVFFDLDRFGRHGHKTMVALNQLADLGISIWDYSTGLAVDLESFEGETMTFLKARFAQQYRDQVRKHTKAALRRQFEAGYVVGGQCYGYTNYGPKGQKRRKPNPDEARVVVEIYERYARGEGYRAIAWALNARKVPAPRAQQSRPSGWSTSTVLAVLDRPLYRGVDYYGRYSWAYGRELGPSRGTRADGTPREQLMLPQSKDTWLRVENDEWRIIPPALAEAVDVRRGDRHGRYLRATNGQLIGKPSDGARYLLSGLLVCPCGGRFEAMRGGNWTFDGNCYVCGVRRRKGPSVCPYKLSFPIDKADDAILSVIEGEVLAPKFIEQVLDTMIEAPDEDRVALAAERVGLLQEIQNLTTAIASGGDIPALATALKERDKRLRALDSRLVPRARPDRDALREALTQRATEWRAILRSNVRQARMVLMQLIGPITVHGTPRPSWIAEPRPDGLLVGMGRGGSSPTGFEPVFWP